jgi:hypothetical protein
MSELTNAVARYERNKETKRLERVATTTKGARPMSYIPKVGDKCNIKSLNSGTVFYDCKILYIDNLSIVFSSSACSSLPMRLIDIEFLPLKTPAEIERDAVIKEAMVHFSGMLFASNSKNPQFIAENLYDAGMLHKQKVKPLSRSYATRDLHISDMAYNDLVDLGFIVQGGE